MPAPRSFGDGYCCWFFSPFSFDDLYEGLDWIRSAFHIFGFRARSGLSGYIPLFLRLVPYTYIMPHDASFRSSTQTIQRDNLLSFILLEPVDSLVHAVLAFTLISPCSVKLMTHYILQHHLPSTLRRNKVVKFSLLIHTLNNKHDQSKTPRAFLLIQKLVFSSMPPTAKPVRENLIFYPWV